MKLDRRIRLGDAGSRPAMGRLACTLLALSLLLGAGACGLLGSKGEEPTGEGWLPLSGVGPYVKEDQDCSQDFIQPLFMDSGDPAVFWGEPWALHRGGTRFDLWFEARSTAGDVDLYVQALELVRAPEGSCRSWDIVLRGPGGAALPGPAPQRVLEGAGAPTALAAGEDLEVWYEMEGRAGIGYAAMRRAGDGLELVEQVEPVLAATEGWEAGFVGSPSVLRNPALGFYQMYYEGDLEGRRSIGYAVSHDGKTWLKTDAAGRNGEVDPGEVQPLLTPSQLNWEYHYPAEPDSGAIGTPQVLLHASPLRVLYYMFYTGNLRGRISPRADDRDTSIGMAVSEDGVHWVKSANHQAPDLVSWEVNPVLNEIFAIDVVDRACKGFLELLDPDYLEKIAGSSNAFCPFVVVDEMTPCVVDLGTTFFLFFQQVGFPEQKGLALALVERTG